MRAKTVRPLLILLLLTALCALPLTAAPSVDGTQAPAPSWTAQALETVNGWLTALFPGFGDADDGAVRVNAGDGLVLGDDPFAPGTDCATCTDGDDGSGGGDPPGGGNGGPDWDPNG